MAQVAGTTIERTAKGNPIYGHVDFRKHSDMISAFENKNVKVEKKAIDQSKNPAVTGVAPRGYMMIEDFFAELEKRINDYCDAKGVP
jgi:dihydroorotate dehydrogenase